MKRKIKVYPAMTFDQEGKLSYASVDNFRMESYVSEQGFLHITLGPVEVEVEFPDDPRQQVLQVLREHRTKLNAKHQATLTRLQFMENALLGIAHTDVLDREWTPGVGNPNPAMDDWLDGSEK